MKKIQLTILVVMLAITSHAQGVQFVAGTSWDQIKSRAKAENKLIFVDCYATWCGPCKEMEREVYPSQKAGEYFNKRFISVKLQMDRKAGDSKETKDRYAMADTLRKRFPIEGYPTFLFLSADGKMLHKGLGYCTTGGLIMMASDVVGTVMSESSGQSQRQQRTTQLTTGSPNPIADVQRLQAAFGDGGKIEYGADTAWARKAKEIDDKYRGSQIKPEEGINGNTWVLNKMAWSAFETCNDEAILKRALDWSDVAIALDKMHAAQKGESINVQLLDTRANLLHKLGRTPEAVAQEEEAIAIDMAIAKKMGIEKGYFTESYSKIVLKMKAGQPTWPE